MTRANPYIGPKAFQLKDRNLFKGRTQEIQKLLNLLIGERIVLLHSPSGSGKTSIINAGLRPKLEEEGFAILPVMRVNRLLPPKVLKNIKVANRYVFSAILSLEQFHDEGSEVRELSSAEFDKLNGLARITFVDYLKKKLTESKETSRQFVLIFDQFEEILSADPTDYAAKAEFFQQVGDALYDDAYWALFAMREDYVASLGSLVRPIPDRLGTRFRLDLLTTRKAREAIAEPALIANVSYRREAVDKLIDDLRTVKVQSFDGITKDELGEFVEPMQLQVVCYRLWQRLKFPPEDDKQVEITINDLEGTHVDKALAEFYEDCIQAVTVMAGAEDELGLRQWIEDKLITTGGTRGMVFMGQRDAAGVPKQVVEELAKRHLLRGEYRAGARWFELTHDRFIEPIKESNRPWLLLKDVGKRVSKGRLNAVLMFLVLALAWLFIEFFVTDPVSESRSHSARRAAIKTEQQNADRLWSFAQSTVNASLEQNDASLVDVVARITMRRQAVEKLITERPRRQKRKEERELKELDVLQAHATQTFETCRAAECFKLIQTIEKLREGIKKNWTDFKLDKDEVALLDKTITAASAESNRPRLERLPAPSVAPGPTIPEGTGIQRFAGVTQPVQEGTSSEYDRLKASIAKMTAAVASNDWKTFSIEREEVREFEYLLSRVMKTVFKLFDKHTRRMDWLRFQEQLLDSDEMNVSPPQLSQYRNNQAVVRRDVAPRDYAPLFFNYRLSAETLTIIIYGLWCLLLGRFISSLTGVLRSIEERFGAFNLSFVRAWNVQDAFGWNITHRTPSLTAIVGLCFLMFIHLRVSWICIQILRSASNQHAWWWIIVVAAFCLTIGFVLLYIIKHYQFPVMLERTFTIGELRSTKNKVNEPATTPN